MTGAVITLGEAMGLFRSAEIGSLAQVSDFRLSIGGAESNVAIGLARLGTPVTWIGRLGADSIGERIVRELRAENVAVEVTFDETAPTGLMLKEQRTPDATRVMYYRSAGAGARLAPEHLPAGLIENARLLHVTGITAALSPTALAALNAAIDRANAANVPVSFDVNHRATLWLDRDARDVYRSIAARATIVFAGLDEAALLAESSTPLGLAEAIARLGPSQVIIKLGSEGCLALVDGVAYECDAISIRPLDTVGAGDAFVAGYLAELLAGLPVADRLATAVRTGAFACLGPGDWESYPRRSELSLLEASDPVAR